MEPTKQNHDSGLSMVLGYTELTVNKTDGSSETVRVRKLPLRLMPNFLAVIDDEAGMVELLCDKPKNWSDSLLPEDAEKVVLEGDAINKSFFDRWNQRRLKRMEQVMPGFQTELLTTLARKLADQGVSQASSPASA